MADQIPSVVRQDVPPEDGPKAAKESRAFADGDYDAIERQGRHRRDEGLRTLLHHVTCAGILVGAGLGLAGAVVLAVHSMTPWKWLTDAQLREISQGLVVALGSGLVTNYGRKLLDRL